MSESIQVSTILPVPAHRLYEAWLNSAEHSAFTDGEATVDPTVGGRFTAWDGYIEGTTETLEPYQRIVQSWRTTDFPSGSPDSRLEVTLEETEGGTTLTLLHSEIPDGQGEDYRQGWVDFYFEPMKRYFSAEASE